MALIFRYTIFYGSNECEINDAEDVQSEFTDDDITAEKVTTYAPEDAQFADQNDEYFAKEINFNSSEVTQSSNQEKREGKRYLDEQST